MDMTFKFGHLMLSAFFLILSIALMGRAKGSYLTALLFSAMFFAVLIVIILWTMIVQTNVEAQIRQDQAVTEFGLMLAHPNMTPEKLEMLAGRFPTLRYRLMRGEVRAMFESTKVPVKMFKIFMQTSNPEYISPQRDWCTAEMPPHIWVEIYNWLVEHKKVLRDSATGPKGHLWIGNSYQHMMAYWGAGRELVDLGKVDRIAQSIDRQYAADEDMEGLTE